ncbi:MAG: hypothetical protein HUK40_24100 [Desulfobacter sp.]|nr:hypothetical protein [Desulfobacter sp.]WDP86826.1 MAG: hypothetical protein HUN05_18255 [Desulfobacter sp.]
MHVFDNDLRMVPEKAGGHTLVLSDRWAINNTANGGYIMALLTRAMGADLPGNNTGDS